MNYGVTKRGKRWTARPYVAGRHVWLGTFDSKAAAVQAAADAIAKQSPPGDCTTVAQLAEVWHDQHVSRLSVSAQRNYRKATDSLCEQLGRRDARTLTFLEVSRWALDVPNTYVKHVRSMFLWAINPARIVETNPTLGVVGRPPARRHVTTVLSESEVRSLAQLAQSRLALSGDIADVVAGMILFAAGTGVRPGEMFALRWGDIDYATSSVRVRRSINSQGLEKLPKNGRERTVALTEMAKDGLALLDPTTEYVFTSARDGRFSKTTFDYWWRQVRTGSAWPNFRFYDLRHTCATRLLERGAASYQVAIQLGHSDNGALVERTYGHPSVSAALDEIRRLDSAAIRNGGQADVG